MMGVDEIFYFKETNEGVVVKKLIIESYRIQQLDRIENKLDRLLSIFEDKEPI